MESTEEPHVPPPHPVSAAAAITYSSDTVVTIDGPTVTHCYHPKSMCRVRLMLSVVLALDKQTVVNVQGRRSGQRLSLPC